MHALFLKAATILAAIWFCFPPPVCGQVNNASSPAQPIPFPKYSNTTEGLRQLLEDVREAAKTGDKEKLIALVKNMEVPNCEAWLYKMYAPDRAESWLGLCEADTLRSQEKSLRQVLEQIAKRYGEINTRKVNDNPVPGRGLEWGWLQAIRQPLDIYFASWNAPGTQKDPSGNPIGYFMFIDGAFRWDSQITVVKVLGLAIADVPESGILGPKNIVAQSVSGGVYSNSAAHFTLTVPEGWMANDNLAGAPYGIGALTAPDGEANILIQQMPTSDSPTVFAKGFDAKGSELFRGYRKISESKLSVAGRDCEVLTLEYIQHRAVTGVEVNMPTVSRMVLMSDEHSLLVFNLVTLESLFDQELPAFETIIKSYHSTVKEDYSPKPK